MFLCRPEVQSIAQSEFQQTLFEEYPDVAVDDARLDVVEDEHLCCSCQQWETEAPLNLPLRATSNEELDPWDLGYKLPKDGQDRRNDFKFLAFVQSVDYDDR